MTQKSNNKKEDINTLPDRDIQELSDAFTSYMDNVISEEPSKRYSSRFYITL